MDNQNSLSYNDYDYTSEELEKTMNGLRKGPWSEEEDSKLISCVNIHGEGKWNTIAILAGLKRSGKSCRLRWVNYLHPNLQRGAFTLQEQLLILELHLRWGNRWSKIAEVLPGRTDNNIKNYWRTKVQKLAKQYDCNVNSSEFRDAIRYVWIPRLSEQIQASNNTTNSCSSSSTSGQLTDKVPVPVPCNNEYGLIGQPVDDVYSMPNMMISNCSDNEPHNSAEICSSSADNDELWDGINWDQIDHFLREMETLDDQVQDINMHEMFLTQNTTT